MGNGQIDGRFAPPQAHVEDVAVPRDGIELASRASRFWSLLIDSVILLALFLLIAKLTPWNIWQNQDPSLMAFTPLEALFSIAMAILPNAYLLAKRGQSIGKYFLKIRIVRPNGSPASFTRLAFLRLALPGALQAISAVGMVYSTIDALWIFRAPRRCLHDLIADTIVVKV